jgi:hypothetical protein
MLAGHIHRSNSWRAAYWLGSWRGLPRLTGQWDPSVRSMLSRRLLQHNFVFCLVSLTFAAEKGS